MSSHLAGVTHLIRVILSHSILGFLKAVSFIHHHQADYEWRTTATASASMSRASLIKKVANRSNQPKGVFQETKMYLLNWMVKHKLLSLDHQLLKSIQVANGHRTTTKWFSAMSMSWYQSRLVNSISFFIGFSLHDNQSLSLIDLIPMSQWLADNKILMSESWLFWQDKSLSLDWRQIDRLASWTFEKEKLK